MWRAGRVGANGTELRSQVSLKHARPRGPSDPRANSVLASWRTRFARLVTGELACRRVKDAADATDQPLTSAVRLELVRPPVTHDPPREVEAAAEKHEEAAEGAELYRQLVSIMDGTRRREATRNSARAMEIQGHAVVQNVVQSVLETARVLLGLGLRAVIGHQIRHLHGKFRSELGAMLCRCDAILDPAQLPLGVAVSR
ncbi:hypothetical protein B0H17DRAFT_1074732 [Mycena rosella]|uniref:Uncharacterized protein n=1 Tax=Mycena rosella TaxID=1033263 RepID=A0AAD7GDZ6_MYCRO|nr:hypothetical protein B0H17DRAFT_1074732 [Mycena rosella]